VPEQPQPQQQQQQHKQALVMLTFRQGGDMLHSLALAEVSERQPGSITAGTPLRLLKPALLATSDWGAVSVKDVAVLAEPLASVAHLVAQAVDSMGSSSRSSSSSTGSSSSSSSSVRASAEETTDAVTALVQQHLCLHLQSQDHSRPLTNYEPRPTQTPAVQRSRVGCLLAAQQEHSFPQHWLRSLLTPLSPDFLKATEDCGMLAPQPAGSYLLASEDAARGMKPVMVSACTIWRFTSVGTADICAAQVVVAHACEVQQLEVVWAAVIRCSAYC
jgi:hypothetical protein